MNKINQENILKLLLIQIFLFSALIFCSSDSKKVLNLDSEISMVSPTAITSTATPPISPNPTSIPSPSPISTTTSIQSPTPNSTPPSSSQDKKEVVKPEVASLLLNFLDNNCMYFESLVDGNQLIHLQEYKIDDAGKMKPKLISHEDSKFWVFIDYLPTKSFSLDEERIALVTEYFSVNDGQNLPKHTAHIYDASSYSREAEFLINLNDKTVILNNGFCYNNPEDFTKKKIDISSAG